MAGLALAGPRPAQAQQLVLAFHEGRVTLDARDVSVRRILEEWARLGKVVVVNAELASDERVSLHLDNVPEREAIDAVLDSASGFVAVARGADTTGPSAFGRILVLDRKGIPAVAPSAQALTPPELFPDDARLDSPVFSDSADEPADGRPDDAGRDTAPVWVASPTSPAEEPPNGRERDVRRMPGTLRRFGPTGTSGAPMMRSSQPPVGSGQAEDLNGRGATTP